MKKSIFSLFFVMCFSYLMATEVAVSTVTGDWWPQIGQDANLPTLDGWYYRDNLASERLMFTGAIVPGTRIATTFGSIGAPYTGMSIKFDATMPMAEGSLITNIILGSNAIWGGQGILIEYTGYGIRAVKNFDYINNMTWIDTSAEYKAALGVGSILAGNEINISPTGLITFKIGSYTSPNSYQADVTVLANTFVMVCPGASGFRFKNVIAKKSGVAKSYFPNYTYTIAATANDGAKGTVTGAGSFEKTSDVTLTAVPASGYIFTKWTDGGVDYSTSNPLIFEATAAKTLVAVFDLSTAINSTPKSTFNVYPSTSKGMFTIANAKVGESYRITNLAGQLVQSGMIKSENQQLNLSKASAGTYLVSSIVEGRRAVVRIVKN